LFVTCCGTWRRRGKSFGSERDCIPIERVRYNGIRIGRTTRSFTLACE